MENGQKIIFTHWKQKGDKAEVYFRKSLIAIVPLTELVEFFSNNHMINYNLLPLTKSM